MSGPPSGMPGLAEAKNHLDLLKKQFDSTWNGTVRALEFLMRTLHQQTERINTLEGNVSELDKVNREKNEGLANMTHRIAALHDEVTEKQRLLEEARSENETLKIALKEVEETKADRQNAAAEVTSLRDKLVKAEKRAMAVEKSPALSGEQLQKMEDALKQELEARSELGIVFSESDDSKLVRKAAQRATSGLIKAYVDCRERVKVLEKQLQAAGVNDTVPASTSSGSSCEKPSGTASHVISGKYRPKASGTDSRRSGSPLATALLQDLPSNAVLLPQHDFGECGSISVMAAEMVSAPNIMPPPQRTIFPSQSSIPMHEIIDLTGFPDETPTGGPYVIHPGVKRRRVDSDSKRPQNTQGSQFNACRAPQDIAVVSHPPGR
ncbi:hypothetical protein K439DRAFT_1619057 [Ramaria rubella]|nr:hypothetical protein K439DRAFT_1619057 [Ramaria rubella]